MESDRIREVARASSGDDAARSSYFMATGQTTDQSAEGVLCKLVRLSSATANGTRSFSPIAATCIDHLFPISQREMLLVGLLTILPAVNANWVQIELDAIYWEDLRTDETGYRTLSCRNFDPTTKHRHRWRFNGSSILPKYVHIRKGHPLFVGNNSNAYRGTFAGQYTCCVRESLGKACYKQQLLLREGNTYDIRLARTKTLEELRCDFGNQTAPVNVSPLSGKTTGNYHHLRIENLSEENVGEYNCTLRLFKKNSRTKKFTVVIGPALQSSSVAASSVVLSVVSTIILLVR
ncbi:unnamed protein product [Nippostrongylus brasiliensis]|uniref:Ig-like domain-containing protein n=1 Tax=Nippostrongylus brasiliensis TaxID=27835 RepID=A0A0N4Y3D5_NIPBR|nr:unnamed protein product [Nippostrongylus brasiliensis]